MKKNLNFTFLFKRKIMGVLSLFCLTTLILLTGSAQVKATSGKELAKVSIEMSNASLEQVIWEIRKQTDLVIMYGVNDVKDVRNLNLNFSKEDVISVLKYCIKDFNLRLEVESDAIVIKKSKQKEQKKELKGTVVDAKGNPLPGVSVVVKGTQRGTATDINGNFVLPYEKGMTLVVSFMGMETREIKVEKHEHISITLKPDRKQIEEVVVMAYGAQKKGSIAGSVSVVSEEKLKDTPVASVGQMLQGKTSGVDIVATSGRPGAKEKITIRGIGSISASTSPLIIIDGMPTNANLTLLNSNDIESVSTLKDASAVALYGARAANGVIIITTKKGTKSKMKISYSGTYGFSEAIMENYEMMTSSELLRYQRDVLKGGLGYQLRDGVSKIDGKTYADYEAINTDWRDEIMQTGTIQTHNLSLSGGNDVAHFYLGLNNYDEEGVIKKVYFKRSGVTFNADMKGREWLTVGTNINIQATESRGSRTSRNALNPFQAVYSMLPWDKMYNEDGTYSKTSASVNPIENTVNNPAISKGVNFIGSVWSKINILDNLVLDSRAGITRLQSEYETATKQGSHLYQVLHNDTKYEYITNYTTHLLNSGLTYHKIFDELHEFSAKAIVEYQKYKERGYTLGAKNFPSKELDYLASAAEPLAAESSLNEWALMSYMANVKYIYDGKYIADLSLRRDGSSRFSEDNRYGNFWAVGLAWNMNKENFLRDFENINSLKLRASIGTSGNDKVGYYDHLPLVGFGKYTDLPAAALTNIGNPDLKWESSMQTSIGLDFDLYDRRVSGTIEVYNKETDDLLLDTKLSRTTGFSSITKNVGKIRNRGIEFLVNTVPVITSDFRWEVGFNIYANESEIIKLSEGQDIVSGHNILREGEEMMAYYMVRIAGVNYANGKPLYYDKDGNVTDTWSADDRVLLDKSPYPDFAGNFNTTLKYKNLSLDMNFYFKEGNSIYNVANSIAHNAETTTSNLHKDLLYKTWKKPGDKSDFPVAAPNSIYGNSTAFLEDASYVRLRDLTLSYQIPFKFLERYKIDNLTLSVRGHNLWTYAPNFKGPDPEIGEGGESGSNFGTMYDYTYPTMKTITFGLSLTF